MADAHADEVSAVIAWYRHAARDLPWRRDDVSPWGVLVSEVMSQQTPVARVAPVWVQWMTRWPTPAALAGADVGDVLRLWGRLGYPRRALRLVECAQAVVDTHGGELPADLDELLALPGVGEYTAGAVVAFAHHRRALVLDTNVRRVLARWLGGEAAPAPGLTAAERERARSVLPTDDATAAAWSVAVMELGALVCTAKAPSCDGCPLVTTCAWVQSGQPVDPAAPRRRPQAWHGTDRQARGLVLAALRAAPAGTSLSTAELLRAAAGAANGAELVDPDQPRRALDSLVADGLVVSDDGGVSHRLPGAHQRSAPDDRDRVESCG